MAGSLGFEPLESGCPEYGAGQASVTFFDAQGQCRHLPPARSDREKVEPFENRNAGTEQSMMRRRAGDTEALDRQVVDADQLDGALHHPVSAVRSQIDKVGPKRT